MFMWVEDPDEEILGVSVDTGGLQLWGSFAGASATIYSVHKGPEWIFCFFNKLYLITHSPLQKEKN